MARVEVFPGITTDPEVRFGKPCIAGTRIDVVTVVADIASEGSVEAVRDQYALTREQVQSALRYAAHLVEEVASTEGR